MLGYLFYLFFRLICPKILENSFLKSAQEMGLVRAICAIWNPSLFMTENDTKEAILHGGFENDCFKINSNYSVFQAAT